MADKKTKKTMSLIQDYKNTFSSDYGKRVLWDLMQQGGMLSNGFVPGDPSATAYNEGGRQVILHVLKQLNINLETLAEMIESGEKQRYNVLE